MHPKLTKIEFVSFEDQSDESFLNATEDFPGNANHKLFDQIAYEQKSTFWWLMKGEKAKESDILWQHESSRPELANGISTVQIEHFLNTDYVFNFEYEPRENDFLKLRMVYRFRDFKSKPRPYIGEYVSFLFTDGKWVANKGYDHIFLDFEIFRKGKTDFWLDGIQE